MDYSVYGIAIIPLIIALVELGKRLGVPSKLLPVASLFLGVLGGLYFIVPDDPKQGIIVGIMMGLSASGLYSGSKHTLEKKE